MRYTFLGHQTWLIEEGEAKILLDPLLLDTFGIDKNFGIEVVPPREIDTAYLQDVSAIILSHEHSDHFHLPSLNKLPRHIPVYVGVLTLLPVINSIKKLGFNVITVNSKESIDFGSLSIRFYQAHPKTVLWECRVYQVLVTSKLNDFSIFVAVDALISKDFEQEVRQNTIPKPSSIMISNNSQIPPVGVIGPLDNALVPQTENKNRCGPVGLGLIRGILVNYSDMVEDLNHIVLCGGGFMKSADTFGEFLMSNQSRIAKLAEPMHPDKTIIGALPGLTYRDDTNECHRAEWIKLNNNRKKHLEIKYKSFISNPQWSLKSLCHSIQNDIGDFHNNCKTIISELENKHRHIVCSEFGRILLSYNDYETLFEIELICQNTKNRKRYAYNPILGTFNKVSQDAPPLLFGIRAMALDLAAVILGKVQIWDIAGLSIISWYSKSLGNSIKYSPMGLLYSLLGEHFNISIYDDICNRNIEQLFVEGNA